MKVGLETGYQKKTKRGEEKAVLLAKKAKKKERKNVRVKAENIKSSNRNLGNNKKK